MGTINYGSNNYINIGLNINAYDDIDENEKQFEFEFVYELIREIREKYDFYYYYVTLHPGYYEGFYLDIESNFPIFFDDYLEKKEAQKEITLLKQFLLECIDAGLVKYSPGWCTGYYSTKETKTALNATIKTLRQEIQDTPTSRQYFKEEK